MIADITGLTVKWTPRCSGSQSQGCYDNNDFNGRCNDGEDFTSGFKIDSFQYDMQEGNRNDVTFSSSPASGTSVGNGKTVRYNIYIDVKSSAATQHFTIDVSMVGSLSSASRPIYTADFDWENTGCTPSCSGKSCGTDG